MIMADQKFGSGHKNSEDFQTCGRTIKTGLIAVGTHNHLCTASGNPVFAHAAVPARLSMHNNSAVQARLMH